MVAVPALTQIPPPLCVPPPPIPLPWIVARVSVIDGDVPSINIAPPPKEFPPPSFDFISVPVNVAVELVI